MSAVFRSFHLMASPAMGGAEISFIRHTTGLVRAGHLVSAGLRNRSQLASLLEPSMTVELFGMRNYLDVRSVQRIRSEIKNLKPDIVQSWASRATWLTRAAGSALHVARLGGYYKPRYFRHADAWIVNTQGLWAWMIRNGFPKHRVEWVPNFVPESAHALQHEERFRFSVPDHALLVVAMGRFIEKKGFADLISAFRQLKAEIAGRPVHLMLIGDGPCMKHLRRLADPLDERVHFTGWLDDPLALLASADVLVCPSRDEPLGNVVLEAWSRRIPVICTRTRGGSELIQNGRTGMLVEIADPAALEIALSELLSDGSRRGMLAENGHRYLLENFSEKRTIEATLGFYQRICSLGHSRL